LDSTLTDKYFSTEYNKRGSKKGATAYSKDKRKRGAFMGYTSRYFYSDQNEVHSVECLNKLTIKHAKNVAKSCWLHDTVRFIAT
jgi:hypothetical protein